jgi:hypothetical protein
MSSISSKLLKNFGALISEKFTDIFSSATSNTYISIGRPLQWEDTDSLIEIPEESTEYINQIYRDMIAVKKVTGSDIQIIIPREDWISDKVYDAYDDEEDLFTTVKITTLPGTVNVAAGAVVVVGRNTQFSTNVAKNDIIRINGVVREVVNISNNTHLTVNTQFNSTAITTNSIFKITDSSPHYAKTFYVRNTKDQVFKCLYNNEGASSTIQPEITVAGQLPEDPYIELSDGYRWKYLYTIPASKKIKFMSKDWMPVLSDSTVTRSAAVGAIDIIKIVNGGTGYISNGNSNSAQIIVITGDGTGANVTAKIESGEITDLNILNGGSGYSYANVTINDTGATGANAEFDVVIPPTNGHGSNPIYELGASHVMIAVELDGDEGGKIPTISGSEKLDYRQIGLIINPRLYPSVAAFANDFVYSTTTKLNVTTPPSGNKYDLDETVYQGSDLENSEFTGTVVHWDVGTKTLHLNNTRGTPDFNNAIIGASTGTKTSIVTKEDTEISPFTGRILYVDNRCTVVRDDQQAENIRLIVKIQ